MPTEDDLREQFHEPRTPAGGIDLDAVLRRARARRRPRVVATALVGTLAVLGIVVPVSVSAALGSNTLFGASGGSAASGAYDSGGKAPESAGGSGTDGSATDQPGIGVAPVAKTELCAGPLAEIAPAADGLVVRVDPVTASTTDRQIPVTVTMTNTGTTAIHGTTSPIPFVTLSREGIVLWHSNGAVASIGQVVDLAPGASMTFSGTFDPVICGPADDTAPQFRSDLPTTGPGTYGISAVVEVTDDGGTSVLVGSAVATVTLH